MSGFFSLGPIFCSFCLIFLRLDGVLLTTLAPALCFCLVCGALLKSSFIFPFSFKLPFSFPHSGSLFFPDSST